MRESAVVDKQVAIGQEEEEGEREKGPRKGGEMLGRIHATGQRHKFQNFF